MTATAIHRIHRDDDRQWRYIVAGAAGAVEYHALRRNGDALGVEYHSPRPLYNGDEPDRCDILEGPCYPSGSGYDGWHLSLAWARAGFDDEVIWGELERRYAEMAREAGQ